MSLPDRFKPIAYPSDFLSAIVRVLGIEGGYVLNPHDPGGETKWGISKRSYPDVDIKSLTREEAICIYYYDFWKDVETCELPRAVAFQLLDIAVNHGSSTAHRLLQRAVGVADDGWIGAHTIAAIKTSSQTDMIMRLIAQRLRFWARCRRWPEFGAGWVNRAAKDLEYGAEDT